MSTRIPDLGVAKEPPLRRGPRFGNRVTQGCRAGRGGQRGREQVSLAELAAEGQQYVTLLVGFHAFGDDLHADRAGELDDAGDDGGVFGFAAQPVDEGPVDLQFVDGEPFEVDQAGVAGAEVVDGLAHPKIFECVQHAEGGVGVAHERGLGHLQRQRRGIQARVGEDVDE